MKLNDFEQYVDEVIIARGRKYHQEKRVESLEKRPDDLYVAAVAGNDDYSVEVELDEQGVIVRAECNCPYTNGPYCKHMVAVFFALRQDDKENNTSKALKNTQKPTKALSVKKKPREQLISDLSSQSKEDLIHFLLNLAESDVIIAGQIRAEFGSSVSGEKEKWMQLLRSYIKKAQDRHGFIDYRSCRKVAEGAYKLVERAQTAVDEDDYQLAVDLALGVMGEIVDMLQFADDSAGDVGMIMNEVDQLLIMLTAAVQNGPESEACFVKILQEAGQVRYNGWPDLRISLLHHCAGLLDNDRQRQQLEAYLAKVCPADSRSYEAEEIALLQYAIIGNFDGREAAAEFLKEHRYFSRFRELAIQEAIAVKNYAGAEQLALEGQAQNKDLPGLVRKWQECLFEIYRQENHLDKMRQISRELALKGEFAYYKKLKALYEPTEWAQIYPDILTELAKRPGYMANTYTAAILEEREWDKLLAYVQKNPRQILDFYRQLLPEYSGQVYKLFEELILRDAAQSNQRSHYKNVCSNLRLLMKIGGSSMANDLIKHLSFEYMRRPAFREELQKLKS